MPNLVGNRFEIEGSAAALEQFVSRSCLALKDGSIAIDLERVIPLPKSLADDELRRWRGDNWGTSYSQDFETIERTSTRLVLRFWTPWSPPFGIYRALATRHPDLHLLAEAAEDGGNETAYRFIAKDGAFSESEPELTDEFISHVTGYPPGDVEFDPVQFAALKPSRPSLLARIRKALAHMFGGRQ